MCLTINYYVLMFIFKLKQLKDSVIFKSLAKKKKTFVFHANFNELLLCFFSDFLVSQLKFVSLIILNL